MIMQVGAPDDWVTASSILTYGGASAAVWIVSNTVRRILSKDSIWIPFIVSLICAILVTFNRDNVSEPLNWFVALVNTCLLFATATGLNETALAANQVEEGGAKRHGSRRVKWLMPWFSTSDVSHERAPARQVDSTDGAELRPE